VKSPAEELLSGTPDRAAASRLVEELAKSGVDVRGMDVYVLPVKGKESSVAYVGLDSSKGFRFKANKGEEPITSLMKRLATSGTAKDAGIQRIAIDYRGSDGKSLVTLTAPTEAISSFANGRLSQQQFMTALEGHADWLALSQEVN
jgi:hypothetical protein